MRNSELASRSSLRPIRLLWIIPVIFIALVSQNTRQSVSNADGGGASPPQSRPSASPPESSFSASSAGARLSEQSVFTPQASTGNTALLTLSGSGAGTNFGDYVSDATGLNTSYHFFIEVPPGLGRLVVDIFDADIGLGGTAEAGAGRDRVRNAFNTSATYSLRNPAGATRNTQFTTGNATGPAGSDNAWLSLFDSTGDTWRDNFGTAVYTNNDGLVNWATNWIETNDDNNATAGQIQITGGQLRIHDNADANPSTIQREANLSGVTTATLKFDVTAQNAAAGDRMLVQVSANGGGTWTTLETFTGALATTTRSYNITSSIASNTRVRFIRSTGYTGATTFFFVDNFQIQSGSIDAGHWELRVDMSSAVTTGDDINAIGIRAHDGTSGAGGTELNVYVDSVVPVGVNPPASGTTSRSYTLFPYITSGCSCAKNDFDFDSNNGNTGSVSFTSRTGAFTQGFASTSMSVDNVWLRNNVSGWTSDSNSQDYGVWQSSLSVSSYLVAGAPNGNYGDFYMSNFQAAANPPTANPVPNALRIYLPTDAGTAPLKPYLEQQVTFAAVGPNPPVVGQTSRFTVTVRVVNPTAKPITFSGANLVTANIPGAGAVYAGTAQVSQGSIVAQPAVGGTGNVTWNPGTLAAGATALLAYRVNVTPTSAGQRIPVTGTPSSGNGTRAQFVDETGNTTQARATFLFGPLCELAVTQGLITGIDLASFTATAYDDGVLLKWETGSEVNNLGFRLYRDDNGRRVPVGQQLIPGSALTAGPGVRLGAGGSYESWDGGIADCGLRSADCRKAAYWLEEIDLRNRSRWHGPFQTAFAGGPPPPGHTSRAQLNSVAPAASSAGAGTPLERSVKIAASSEQMLATQSGLASQPALKLVVKHEGWYRVTQPQMIAAGFDPGNDARLLQLFVDGRQVPIKVVTGKGGQFDSTSGIEFYGLGIDSAVTNARVYWLVAGSEPGLRIAQTTGGAPPSSARSFLYTVERKDRTLFFFSLKNGDQENFFGGTVAATPLDQPVTLQHLDLTASAPATIEVAIQGATFVPHRVRVQLNGTDVGTLSFDSQAEGLAKLNVSQALLREGSNTVTLTAMGGDSDIGFVDYVRVSYWHTFTADSDGLRLAAPGKQQVNIAGFTNSSIHVVDITDANAVQELQVQVAPQKGGGYTVKAAPAGNGQRTLLALTDAGAKPPDSLSLNRPSSWRTATNAADLVIIGHRTFLDGLEPLRTLRENQGLSVAVVDVEDVYDEFSYGQKTPQAIRDFLSFAATNWQRAPRFVLLAGSASRDPKNYLGFGDLDLVPAKNIDTSLMEAASDDWFVDFNGGGLPEIPIGRLPARSTAQLAAMIAKIVGYEQSIPSNEVLLFADSNSGGYDFAAASATLGSLLPPQVTTVQIDRNQTDAASARVALLEAIGRGQKLVNYTGHGSATIWKDFVLTAADAQNLNNAGHLPLFVMMTCLNGYFVDPGSSSLGESLMTAERGGAIAVWASSGMTSPPGQTAMDQQFFQTVFSGGSQSITLGEATVRAKASITDTDVRRTWILFGDPTTRLK